MDSGLSGEADQHLGDRSNHHQVRTEVILGSYWTWTGTQKCPSRDGWLAAAAWTAAGCTELTYQTMRWWWHPVSQQSGPSFLLRADTDLPSQEGSTKKSWLTSHLVTGPGLLLVISRFQHLRVLMATWPMPLATLPSVSALSLLPSSHNQQVQISPKCGYNSS